MNDKRSIYIGRLLLVVTFVLAATFFTLAALFTRTAPVHADTSGMSSTTVSIPDVRRVSNIRDVLDEVLQFQPPSAQDLLDVSAGASAGASASASAAASATSTESLGSQITNQISSTLSTSASSTTGTSGLGAAIADAITGGVGGFGTSDFGPYIKCVLLSGIGWPIPTYATECPTGTTTPPTKGTLTVIKNTVGGNGDFGFTVTGNGTGTTTLSTSGGSASVNFILSPGTFTISEDTLASGWLQTSRGCTLNATTTGSTSGSLGWSFSISAGQHITCTFVNTATSTSTSTPPGGGGGCVENCGGGGGCVSNCGGSSGSSGGGGGGGGGNGPISTSGSPGTVAGASTTTPPEAVGGAVPEVPNTGVGDSTGTLATLIVSLATMLFGLAALVPRRRG